MFVSVLMSGREAMAFPCFVPDLQPTISEQACTVPPAQTVGDQEENKILNRAKLYYPSAFEQDYSGDGMLLHSERATRSRATEVRHYC